MLVLDSSTFIREIGLTSTKGSALKHYLYCRGTQLVVPQAACGGIRTALGQSGEREDRAHPEGITLVGTILRWYRGMDGSWGRCHRRSRRGARQG